MIILGEGTKAIPYINHGRVIADCPFEGCYNAMRLQPGQTDYVCIGGCGQAAQISWPYDLGDALAELEKRPNAANRNWFPAGHPLAIRLRQPHGQSVAELAQETKENSLWLGRRR